MNLPKVRWVCLRPGGDENLARALIPSEMGNLNAVAPTDAPHLASAGYQEDSPALDDLPRLVEIADSEPWCSLSWQEVYEELATRPVPPPFEVEYLLRRISPPWDKGGNTLAEWAASVRLHLYLRVRSS